MEHERDQKEKRKLRFPAGSIMLIMRDSIELAANAKIIRSLHLTGNLLRFASAKDAFDNLKLFKDLPITGVNNFPDLIISDQQDEHFFSGRSFLDDLLALYPDPEQRPYVIILWKGESAPDHKMIGHTLKKPLLKDKLRSFVESQN